VPGPYATNAVQFDRPVGPAPAGALGLIVAADASDYKAKALWAAFDAGRWTAGDELWVPADAVNFLTRAQIEEQVRALHQRMSQTGRVVRYLPPCGHTSAWSAARDFCGCSDVAAPGAVAAVADPDVDGRLAGSWAYLDTRHGGYVRIDAEARVTAEHAQALTADQFVELLVDLAEQPWAALLALGERGLSNPQQDLLNEYGRRVMPGVVRIGDTVMQVIVDEGDQLIVHMIGSGTAAGRQDEWRGFGMSADRDLLAHHQEENRFDVDTLVIEYGSVLGRVSKSLTAPVTLDDWLRHHDTLLNGAYSAGVDAGRGW
jgi:hypothetical protein